MPFRQARGEGVGVAGTSSQGAAEFTGRAELGGHEAGERGPVGPFPPLTQSSYPLPDSRIAKTVSTASLTRDFHSLTERRAFDCSRRDCCHRRRSERMSPKFLPW